MKTKLLLFLLSFTVTLAQEKTTIGSLQRINILSSEIDLADTVDRWREYRAGGNHTVNYYSDSYMDVFTYKEKLYFVKSFSSFSDPYGYFDVYSIYLFDKFSNKKIPLYGRFGFTDVINPPNFPSSLRRYVTDTGFWLLTSLATSVFISDNDSSSIARFQNDSNIKAITHIPGKIKDKFILATITSHFEVDYFLDDLKESPILNLSNKIYFVTDDYISNWAPSWLQALNDSIYFVSTNQFKDAYLMSFANDRFNVLKKIDLQNYTRWLYKNGWIYFIENGSLLKMFFNEKTNEFVNKMSILNNLQGVTSYDLENSILVNFINDSLSVFDIQQGRLINSISTKNLPHTNTMFFSYPYVYLQRIDKITEIENIQQIPTKFQLHQNYPNPFNPSTTISYSISQGGQVTLKIYNVLGREVATLVNENKVPGNYEVKFNGNGLASGIYIYRIQAGDFVASKKLILLK